ncbi:magnesium-translocating P-type ATPase MgtA [methanogenic archaeon mixed culture ISO4-G1]|nr:magnesium-translocating P-type ATPase MgtA [methanogenic archaeon mixed culture ISO4-G1]
MKEAASSDVAEIIEKYDSRIEGHYNEELTTSRIKYGENIVSNHNTHAVLRRLYHAFVNVFIIALTIIDIIWLIPGLGYEVGEEPDLVYFVILTTLILVSGTMTFIQETRSSAAASKLINMVTTIITVRRENVETEVDSCDLVVGDILILDTGDVIPADVRIIKSNHLKVDQSALTGESDAATKFTEPVSVTGSILECNNMAFMGTSVMEGSAEAIVIAVGDDTVIGSMAEKLSTKKTKTTYDKGSKAIVKVLLKLMLYTIPPVFIIMIAKAMLSSEGLTMTSFMFAVTFTIVLAIGLMPEMLATIVSTNLAKGSIDLSKRKVIVKDVNSIQNFGAMDVLCSDKTGTLTENRISVESCNDIYGTPNALVERLVCLNSTKLTSATNQIDWAIQEHAENEYLMEELDDYQWIGDVPFDFIRRRATVVVRKGSDPCIMVTKGAVPEILAISDKYLDENGDAQELDDATVSKILGLVEWYSNKGMRVLGVTHRHFSDAKSEYTPSDESGQTFAGFVVFTDPVKRTAKKAIQDLNDYGIKVKVLTGDNEYVSHYVCDQIGIRCDVLDRDIGSIEEFEPEEGKSFIITGPQIDEMSDEVLAKVVEANNVFVRLTPDNKSRIVMALRNNGHCVGLMGDGINDVLAMKNADVSISVDTGTDIAKETASMILLEKDLGILKDGAIEGRKVYVNSIKYVKMIGSINFGYMFSLILATLLFNFSPMGAMMILIFNLINDFACLIIPWDKVEDEFVREPRKWDAINLRNVMFHYGPMCPLTDVMTWCFMIFVIFGSMPLIDTGSGTVFQILDDAGELAVDAYGNYVGAGFDTVGAAILGRAELGGTNVEALFQAIWVIEQYWMQVWAIHIVRTNKMPFYQSWSCKALVVSAIVALIIGTLLPFSGELWAGISEFPMEVFQPDFLAIAGTAMIWMPFIACVYFFGSHMVKKRMLRTHGYFAC